MSTTTADGGVVVSAVAAAVVRDLCKGSARRVWRTASAVGEKASTAVRQDANDDANRESDAVMLSFMLSFSKGAALRGV